MIHVQQEDTYLEEFAIPVQETVVPVLQQPHAQHVLIQVIQKHLQVMNAA